MSAATSSLLIHFIVPPCRSGPHCSATSFVQPFHHSVNRCVIKSSSKLFGPLYLSAQLADRVVFISKDGTRGFKATMQKNSFMFFHRPGDGDSNYRWTIPHSSGAMSTHSSRCCSNILQKRPLIHLSKLSLLYKAPGPMQNLSRVRMCAKVDSQQRLYDRRLRSERDSESLVHPERHVAIVAHVYRAQMRYTDRSPSLSKTIKSCFRGSGFRSIFQLFLRGNDGVVLPDKRMAREYAV
jgi:hypothetical protein